MRTLLMTTVLASALAAAGAASAQSTIRPGQTVQGNFTAKDARMGDGSHYRCYVVQTNPDEAYTVTLSSADFDTYLSAGAGADCDDTSITNDDGPDMGTNSQLRFASSGGLWIIKANTLSEGETGRYELRVSAGERIRPTTQVLPIAVGESRSGRLEFSDRRADDGSFYDCYALTIARGQRRHSSRFRGLRRLPRPLRRPAVRRRLRGHRRRQRRRHQRPDHPVPASWNLLDPRQYPGFVGRGRLHPERHLASLRIKRPRLS